MASLQVNSDVFTLNDGSKIPAIGLGTWRADKKGEAYQSVLVALKNGYRHIDTAKIYGNEDEVGQAIIDSGVPRKEIYVTTKLWNTDHKNAAAALDKSLELLQLDYVDLYLVHWPAPVDENEKPLSNWTPNDSYKEIVKLLDTGKVKSVGISNYNLEQTKAVLEDPSIKVKPVVNQIEAHPLLTQPELYDYLYKNDIYIEAYSPLGSVDSPLLTNPTVVEIGKKHNANAGQVLVSWAVQRKTIVLPKSVTESRIIGNLKTFKLPEEDFEILNQLEKKDGTHRTNLFKGVFDSHSA
ncbi:hypothetical protein QCA50_019225 [Cerrena zonata]|uniref:2-dehydropantolactone reductase n=2 Tax=Dikarya TaxID=451864 RepID=A0A1E4RP87_9ASCO|nr:Aldo/keto reductase [Hyphopichia burtonii NRRL Y-1933]ODV69083.1 Aldo/keto reductase [Hyphopichia burtonii NRRL Y-1933]